MSLFLLDIFKVFRYRGIGEKTLREIVEKMQALGFRTKS